MSDRKLLKFLCFTLGERFFALDIMGVREILRLQPVTLVPDSPETILGVINVRGELVTVLDMRKIFGVLAGEPERRDMRIILAGVHGNRFGILVDSVQDVATLEVEEVDPAPIGSGTATVIGLFKRPRSDAAEVVVLLRLGALAKMARGEVMNAALPEEVPLKMPEEP